ncbi:MAG: GlmU family protein [Bacteroidota bacterium]
MAKNYILFDSPDTRKDLLPLTFTRPIAGLRIGILTICEKWNKYLNTNCSFHTEGYLSEKFPITISSDNVFIDASVLPSPALVKEIEQLKIGQMLVSDSRLVACRMDEAKAIDFSPAEVSSHKVPVSTSLSSISYPWDIFLYNDAEIRADYKLIVNNRISQPLSGTNNLIGNGPVFLEPGAMVEGAILNTTNGPIYIGKDAEVMEGSMIRGPFVLAEHSSVKMGAKIYGATTIGPHSKVGGELNNVVINGYSNKAHDGFLGNAVLGEWCNMGADSNNSNLKNNYAEVRLWNYRQERFIKSGQQFAGLIMGDHSKCGINTMFNTGTVVGVSANIFGAGFPRNFVPSFSWGGPQGISVYALNKAFETAEKVLSRRNIELNDIEKNILKEVFKQTEQYRRF